MKNYRIIISGGGTGGHIFPAISIANKLKQRYPSVEILFVGAENRMEMEKVPAAGYKIVGLPVSGFDRTHLLKNIKVACQLLKSLFKAYATIRTFKPDIAVGVGGFASGPVLRVSSWLGIPTLIQEQNSYAGITNKLLARSANRICVAYEGMDQFFPTDKIIITGNPVRHDLEEALDKKDEALSYFGLTKGKKTILVVGGSLGAKTINASVIASLDTLFNADDIQLIWQTGKLYYKEATKFLKAYRGIKIYHADFINRMDYAYALADLVISRAGASSISELCLLRKPVLLVPSPNVAEDHQTKNAQALVQKEAAIMITDMEARTKLFSTALAVVRNDAQLEKMSHHIADLALRNAADRIVDEIIKIIEPSKAKK